MKKLMIAAAIVCAAAMSHAVQASWGFNNLAYDPDAKGPAYTAYLMNAADYSIANAITALEGGDLDFLSKAVATAGTLQQGTLSAARIATTYSADKFTPGDTYTLYTVVLNDGADSSYAYVSAGITAKAPDKGYQDGAFGNLSTGSYKGEWHSVPEPTSGLLLLLGVAGLALRRRRA